jgi:hypothetical protein
MYLYCDLSTGKVRLSDIPPTAVDLEITAAGAFKIIEILSDEWGAIDCTDITGLGEHLPIKLASSKPRVPLKIILRSAVGEGIHFGGWPYVRAELAKHHSDNGFLFDDFVEQSFLYSKSKPIYSEPWGGVIHHPPGIPDFVSVADNLTRLFALMEWKESLKTCKFLIALSSHLGDYLSGLVNVPVFVLKHPVKTDVPQWDANKFANNPDKMLIQAGSYLRNTSGIYQIPKVFLKKADLVGEASWVQGYRVAISSYWRDCRRRSSLSNDVQVLSRLSDDEYEDSLLKNVFFTEYFAVSASNVVLECIAHGTPLVVNRLPAVEEYLGSKYPLFYSSIGDISEILTTASIIKAHEHLQSIPKQPFSVTRFAASVLSIISECV